MSKHDFRIEDALQFPPFDSEETDTTLFSDRIVKAAKDHPRCHICEGGIKKGERHRALTERNNEDGIVTTFRFCGKCCRAMAHPDTWDSGRLISSRYRIGECRRGVKRGALFDGAAA